MPRLRRRECRKSGRCLKGTLQMRLKRVLGRVGDAHAGEQREHDADHERGGAAGERVQFELVADDRNLPERAVEDLVLLAGVALQHEAEDRDEHEQQREQRDERVVGDQRGELAGLVVAELLDDRREEAERRGCAAGGDRGRAGGR